MSNISEAVIFSYFLRPFLNGAAFNFNCFTTALADQVMMMALATEAIDSLAIIAA
jgi:hypothetical protein